MHAFPKSLINSTKNGTEKNFVNQWLSISPNSMISFKFYVQTPFFSTFITLHLGKGHIQTVNRYSGPDGVCYGQFIYWCGLWSALYIRTVFSSKLWGLSVLVGQLSTWKWQYCAVSVKSVRFGGEGKQSIRNIFLICHILWHFQDGRHCPWQFYMGQKLKHSLISLKKSVKLFVLS